MTGPARPTLKQPVPGSARDEGSGTVLVLSVVAVLLTLAVAAASLLQAAAARHRAETAADLAALAAAQTLLDGLPGDPCGRAGQVASLHRASLTGCRLAGEHAWVSTSVVTTGLLSPLGPATGNAHAGPGAEEP